ncbi:MAG TPA: DNA recombination protein RmuC [Sediminibacterium sp.]|nr:DNA recombination protein RmuC [Sediminibacterium sp.]HQS54601.1 DNA recombination protein RmuC [Sediminibacterium sp.]
MIDNMSIAIILLSAIAGSLITFFLYRAYALRRFLQMEATLQQKQQTEADLQQVLKNTQSEKEQYLMRATQAETKLVMSNVALAEAKEAAKHINEQIKLEFGELAQQIMETNSKKFTLQNQEQIGQILQPLKTELGDFKKKVEETYDKESKERFTLGREIDRLVQMSLQVSTEANNLTTALKGSNKLQGNWGEMILESILEHSGLVKGREYLVQEFIKDQAGNIIKDENGKGLQPDVTIFYPDQRKLIIDSKVSLLAWDEYSSETDPNLQEAALKRHIASIRAHMDGLSRKNYPKYAQALDYVLLFIPIEPAFLEAVKKDTQLWKNAYDKKIMLVSPTNLLAVLKIIADIWKVTQQTNNAVEIAERAGLLYDKFVLFLENLEVVGKKMAEAQTGYEAAMKQLGTGRGNLIGKVEELKKMGAAASKQIPDKLLYQLKEE